MALNRQSTLDLQGYIQALVSYADQKTNGVNELGAFRDALFEKIQNGDGKTLTNSSPGGKSFQFEITMTVEEQFAAVVKAIEICNGAAGSSPITFPDLSRALGPTVCPPCDPIC